MSAVSIPPKACEPMCDAFADCPDCHSSLGNPTLDLKLGMAYAVASLKVWGIDKQRTMAMGEAGEFIDVLAKHDRARVGPFEVADEAADNIVGSLVGAAIAGVDARLLAERIEFKMARTEAKMAAHSNKVESAGGGKP